MPYYRDNIYEIEPMHSDIPTELVYDVYYVNEPATWEYPSEYELSISDIRHKGKPVKNAALIKLFSIHFGYKVTMEQIEEIILNNWDGPYDEHDPGDYADYLYKLRKEEGI